MNMILNIIDAIPAWMGALAGLVAAASAIAALTPTPRDDLILGKLYRLLDALALNIGKAKDQPSNHQQ